MMAKTKKQVQDICECGHKLSQHETCDCPHCKDGVHGCYGHTKKGDYCECDQYVEKQKVKK